MATKYSAPKYDFQKTLQWINGDKYYLQVSTEAFYNMFDQNHKQRERSNREQLNSKQLLRISKRAFEKGELDVAEKFVGKAIQRQKIEDASSERNPELYYHLAEVLQQRATKDTLQKLERQKLLLQATALYMFVRNCLNKSNEKSELVVNISKSLPQKILDVQHYIIETASGNTSTCKFNCEIKKKALKELRKEANASLEDINNKYDAETGSDDDLREKFIKQTSEVKTLFKRIATRVKQLFVEIIEECLDVLGNPPCDYEVMILGSLAREEMTPYSDIEWAILTNSEDEECKTFFRNLTNLVHFQIINLGETILPCLDIEVLRGDWFYDDVTPRGLSFDALLPQACKTPLGNTVDFELIHTPQTMANFQSEYWHKKKPHLGDILLTVAPLKDDQQTLLSQYKEIVEKILLEPCDKDNCSSNNTILTKGASRGHQILSNDADRYGKTILDSHQAFDGKVYDVKKEVYRLTDRVVAGLSKVFGIATNGSFEILDGLCQSNVICSSAKENISSAVAIALKFRLSTYLLAEKQDEAIKTRSKDSSNETWLANSGLTTYDVARKKELFHFFYVSTPLYELLRTFSADDRMNSEDFMGNLFFDCSDKVKGHIHCRLLNYIAALDCYKRAQCNVKSDYENIDLRIRRLRLEFMLSMSSDVLFIKEELKVILEEIDKKATDSKASKHERKFLDQFVDVHLFHASFCLSQGDVEIARESLEQCKNIESYVSDFQKLAVRLNIIHVSQIQTNQKEFDDIISQLNALVKDEGNSVMGLIWLNELGKFLMHQKKNAEAYQCLQRALLMGRILFSNNVNFHVLWTLFMLGTVCFRSLMYEEAKFYFSKILEPLLSLDEQMSVIMKREVYRQLATLSTFTDNQEDAITFFENSLECSNISGGRANADLMVDGLTHCGIATTWFKLGENEKAWISALNAKDCLEKIPYNQNKVSLECFVSKTFMDIGKTNEAMLLLKQGLAKQHDAVFKENYLDSLGQLCFKKGLKEDAEYYYKKSLEILKSVNSDTPKIIERLLNIADLLINNKKSSEAFIYLSDTSKYVLALVDSNEKCNYLKKMAYNWEEMGDYYEARNCLEQAVKVCESSEKNAKVLPIDEFDLHIKLSDVVAKTLASLSSNDEVSTNEQIKNAKWLHYDRAGNALRRQLATGQFNSQTVSLFLLLASKYHSIDLMEKEKLLLEALEISKLIYGPEEKNKQVASILIELADLYLSKKEYESAASFFERSLQMDMEIHRLDPYHINISHEIFVLTGLFGVSTVATHVNNDTASSYFLGKTQ
ncbi:uncharacterized protein LOC124447896 isoform X2 [Xenia sp. Carnegie-2017]|nr:uncharacterized protein LOC124447896 isoform X2 [Xenia sp. Carnegie-2017]